MASLEKLLNSRSPRHKKARLRAIEKKSNKIFRKQVRSGIGMGFRGESFKSIGGYLNNM